MDLVAKLFQQKPSEMTTQLLREGAAALANRPPAAAPYLTPRVMDTLVAFLDAVAGAGEAAVAFAAALDAVKPVGEAATPTLYDLQSVADTTSGRLDTAHRTALAMAMDMGMTSDLLDAAMQRRAAKQQ